MPNITIPKKTIDSLSNREGVYSKLRFKEAERKLTVRLSEKVEDTVRLAFYEWAEKHKGGSKIVDTEWKRFQKILQRYL
jgi:hypothetical protein